MVMTIEEYDKISERFDGFKAKKIWPSPKDIEKMEEDPERWILFACYLYEGRAAKTAEQKYSKKNLQEFIHRHLQLVDSEEEKEGVIIEQKQCSC